MEQILNAYYADNAERLHKIVDRILLRFGGISDKDVDDFYSLANEVFVDVMRRYDGSQAFDTFLYFCLLNRMKTEMTRKNRKKREADRNTVSIDTPTGDDENTTIGDVIAGNFDIEKEIFDKNEEAYSKKMALYLERLSCLQKKVLNLLAEGYLPNEIREELHISKKEFSNCSAAIHSYRNTSILL